MQSEIGIDWHVSGGEGEQTNKTISTLSMEAGKLWISLPYKEHIVFYTSNYFKKPHKKDLKKIVFLIKIPVLA